MLDLLTKQGAAFLLEHTPFYTTIDSLSIQCLNGTPDIDGYVNHIYRLQQKNHSLILKQAKDYLVSQMFSNPLEPERNYREYISYQLRQGITPDYVPKVYYANQQQHFFIMEDLVQQQTLRKLFCTGSIHLAVGKQIGEFLAKNHFYTSSLSVSSDDFNYLDHYFENPVMKSIILDFILAFPNPIQLTDAHPLDQALADIGTHLLADEAFKKAWLQTRQRFLDQKQCLIHGDFHTSNIFFQQRIQVIDMEYSMLGPFAYDLGYYLANILSQIAAYSCNQHVSSAEGKNYVQYLLSMLMETFQYYQLYLQECCHTHHQSAIDFTTIFQDSLGFLAIANLSRILNHSEFPDFDVLPTKEEQFLAKSLSIKLSEGLLLGQQTIKTTAELSHYIHGTIDAFLKDII